MQKIEMNRLTDFCFRHLVCGPVVYSWRSNQQSKATFSYLSIFPNILTLIVFRRTDNAP